MVSIDNTCPECPVNHLELNKAAFAKIVNLDIADSATISYECFGSGGGGSNEYSRGKDEGDDEDDDYQINHRSGNDNSNV